MATKKSKSTSKHRKSRSPTAAAKKTKKKTLKRVVKAKAAKKAPARKAARKKTSARSVRKKKTASTQREFNQDIRRKNLGPTGMTGVRQSPDLQGLSRVEQADSESVDELVDEGNLFEAGAVAGVEEADSEDEREVHTHEMPEDDVPDEYLDDK